MRDRTERGRVLVSEFEVYVIHAVTVEAESRDEAIETVSRMLRDDEAPLDLSDPAIPCEVA